VISQEYPFSGTPLFGFGMSLRIAPWLFPRRRHSVFEFRNHPLPLAALLRMVFARATESPLPAAPVKPPLRLARRPPIDV